MLKMKKSFVFGAIMMAIMSCSSKSEDIVEIIDGPQLLKKVETNGVTAFECVYSGTKVITIGNKTFTYTGDLITKEVLVDENYVVTKEYTYEDNRLKSTVSKSTLDGVVVGKESKTDFIYNSDGTVTA